MFRVKVTGVTGLKAQFEAETEKIESVVSQELREMAKEWVRLAKTDAPADQGALMGAISYFEKSPLSFEVVAQKFYAPFMEFGTKGKYRPIPGTEAIAAQFKGFKGGDFQELLRMIVRWVHRKGIAGTYSVKTRKRTGSKVNQFAEDYSVAWPIAMSILKKGVSPHPFFFKQMHIVWPQMIRNVKQRMEVKAKVTVPGELWRPQIK